MIRRIRWPRPAGGELPSPFVRGEGERPIRITFHTDSLYTLPSREADALAALKDLAHLSEIEPLGTEPSDFPHIKVGSLSNLETTVSVEVDAGDSRVQSFIPYANDYVGVAQAFTCKHDPDGAEAKATLRDLLLTQAHVRLRQDIFVTSSPVLLAQRAHPSVAEANPLLPSEAGKVVGLFLRSRDNYTIRAVPGVYSVGRGNFYWVLVRNRLHNMWRYFSACVRAAKKPKPDTGYIGQSILTRCVRAVEARDNINLCFMQPADSISFEAVMYHFVYLTLLLAGGLDAQARIAHRAYDVGKKPPERSAGFKQKEFLHSLSLRGGQQVVEVVSSPEAKAVLTLLYSLRNTIHGAEFPTVEVMGEGHFVTIPTEKAPSILAAAQACGPSHRWGLKEDSDLRLDPFEYTNTLVDECLRLVNEIAVATDVSRLLPPGEGVDELMTGPPDDWLFSELTAQRIDILG